MTLRIKPTGQRATYDVVHIDWAKRILVVGQFTYERTKTFTRETPGVRKSFIRTAGTLNDWLSGNKIDLGCYSTFAEAREAVRQHFEHTHKRA